MSFYVLHKPSVNLVEDFATREEAERFVLDAEDRDDLAIYDTDDATAKPIDPTPRDPDDPTDEGPWAPV